MNGNLTKLKELTDKLPEFPEPILGSGNGVNYEMEYGKCTGWKIIWRDRISITKWFNTKGTRFPKHIHTTEEHFFVYQGVMMLHLDKTTITLKVGESYYLLPGSLHGAYFPEDCRYITVNIPSEEKFPK